MLSQDVTISGFMILKNAISQGYPFLEAIVAALPICDEFLISDGYSLDGTWDALQFLYRGHSDKIRLFRDEWRGPVRSGEILAVMTNVLLERCTGSYCLYIQGNDILHECYLQTLRRLPILYPNTDMFKLPFYTVMGASLLWMFDFRWRLFKRKDYIRATGDAYDVGFVPKRLLFQPRKLLDYALHATGERICYLPRPVYKYRALFPRNYLTKLESRPDMYQAPNLTYFWKKEHRYALTVLEEVLSEGQPPEVFWQKMKSYFDEAMWTDLPDGLVPSSGLPRYCIGELKESPETVRHLLGRWEYNVQDSLDFLSSRAGYGRVVDQRQR
jgi:hypothetical protein